MAEIKRSAKKARVLMLIEIILIILLFIITIKLYVKTK